MDALDAFEARSVDSLLITSCADGASQALSSVNGGTCGGLGCVELYACTSDGGHTCLSFCSIGDTLDDTTLVSECDRPGESDAFDALEVRFVDSFEVQFVDSLIVTCRADSASQAF